MTDHLQQPDGDPVRGIRAAAPWPSWRPFVQAYVVACAFGLTLLVWPSVGRLVGLLLTAGFAAIALDAATRTLQRLLGVSRRTALGVIVGTVLTAAAAGLVLVLPVVVRELRLLSVRGPRLAEHIASSDAWEWFAGQTHVRDGSIRAAQGFVSSAPNLVGGALTSMVGTVFNAGLLIIVTLFLLSSGRDVLTLGVRLAPGLATARPWDVVAEVYESIGRYVLGALTQATIAGFTIGTMLWILDVPYALALGLITFFWDFIPMIGSTIAGIPCVVIAFASHGLGMAIFVALFVIAFTQFENYVLQPRIHGRAAKLPRAAIFFAVLAGGTLYGIVGAIMAVPAASVIATILRHVHEHRGVADLEPPQLFDDHGQVVRGGA